MLVFSESFLAFARVSLALEEGEIDEDDEAEDEDAVDDNNEDSIDWFLSIWSAGDNACSIEDWCDFGVTLSTVFIWVPLLSSADFCCCI